MHVLQSEYMPTLTAKTKQELVPGSDGCCCAKIFTRVSLVTQCVTTASGCAVTFRMMGSRQLPMFLAPEIINSSAACVRDLFTCGVFAARCFFARS